MMRTAFRSTNRLAFTVIFASVGAAALVACGDDSSETGTTSDSSTTSGAGGATTSTTAGTGGEAATGTGGGAATGTGGGATGTGGGATTTTGVGGTGGAGTGGSGGGAGLCNPGEVQSCYSGPAGTDGVGTCLAGTQTCAADGMSFGPCGGEVLPGAEVCGNGTDEDCSGSDMPCGASSLVWAKSFGAAGDERCLSVDSDANGNVAITGRMGNMTNFGGGALATTGPSDAYLAKFDASGNHQWSKRFGGASATAGQEGDSVAFDALGDVYVGGRIAFSVDFGGGALSTTSATDNDAFIAKFSAAGVHQWSKDFGDAADQSVNVVKVAPNGNIILGGRMSGPTNFGGANPMPLFGARDGFIAIFDPAGAFVFQFSFGGPGDEQTDSIAIDSANNIIISGFFSGSAAMGGGTFINATAGGNDGFVAKYSAVGGALMWAKAFGDATDQSVNSVAIDANDDIVLTGTTAGTMSFGGGVSVTSSGLADVYVAKLDGATGNGVWANIAGDAATAQAVRIVDVDANGNVGIVGPLLGAMNWGGNNLTSAGLADVYTAKFSPAGAHLWSYQYGDAGDQRGSAFAWDSQGNALLAGQFAGTLTFGATSLVGAGSNDIFIAKYTP